MTTAPGITPLLSAVYASTSEGEVILRRLTRAAGFSADNVVSRLAIARSLSDPPASWDDPVLDADTDGKQIRGSTLLGRHELAASLLAMIVEAEGEALSADELRQLVRLHWERGLRLIDGDIGDGGMQELIVAYAEKALLSEGVSQERAALSPDTVIGAEIVGQGALKRELAKLIRQALRAEPPRLTKPLLILGAEGSGRSVAAKSVAAALQLPFVELTAEQLDPPDAAIAALEQQLAVQGYVPWSGRGGLVYPSEVIHVRGVAGQELGPPTLALLRSLQPQRRFSEWGTRRLRVAGGGVVVSVSKDMVSLEIPSSRLTVASYSRDEVVEILRREIGSWPVETRRYLALAGHLNPGRSVVRGREFLALARSRSTGGRPSEGLLLEVMRERWGMDRLGLTNDDYAILGALLGHQASGPGGDMTFLEQLRLVKRSDDTFSVTERGQDAFRVWREAGGS